MVASITAITMTIKCILYEKVKWLIQSKQCNLNIPNKNGDTPLHIACFVGKIDCVQLLMSEPECNLNYRNKYGDTPLHIACLQGTFEW